MLRMVMTAVCDSIIGKVAKRYPRDVIHFWYDNTKPVLNQAVAPIRKT